MIAIFKAHVRGHLRRRPGQGVIYVNPYHNRVKAKAKQPTLFVRKHPRDSHTRELFGQPAGPAKDPETVGVHGLRLMVQYPRGSHMSKRGPGGEILWQHAMLHHYGAIGGTRGADGDAVDAWIGPNLKAPQVYVINQHLDGKFDEHKVCIGFNSADEARAGYLAHYPTGWAGLHSIVPMTPQRLKRWLRRGDMSQPAA